MTGRVLALLSSLAVNVRVCSIALCMAVAIGGCQSIIIEEPPVIEWSPATLPRAGGINRDQASGSGTPLPLSRSGRGGKTQFIAGSGRLIGSARTREPTGSPEGGEDGVTLNLINVPVAQAAKVVLGDILSANFIVDPKVDGKVTIHTTTPVRRSAAVELFEQALRSSNAAIVENGGVYNVVPADQATTSGGPIRTSAGGGGSQKVGEGVEVVQLRYASAGEIKRVLEPITPRGGIVRADDARNALTLSGTQQEIATIKDAIAIFDVDTMRGMSFALVPVTSSDADALAEDLRNVFGSEKEGPMNGMVRFIGNKRLSAILIISPQRAYLSRAEAWIRRLDARAQGSEKQFYTYRVQNRPAKELVGVLGAMFGDRNASRSNNVAPRYQETAISSNSLSQTGLGQTSPVGAMSSAGGEGLGAGGFGGQNSGFSGGGPGSLSSSLSASANSANSAAGPNGSPPQAVALGEDSRFKLAVDEAKNALVIMATPEDYKRLLRVIESLDVLPNQVLIEATIAEVSLNDKLQFGVRWFFQSGGSSAAFTNKFSAAEFINTALSGVFPGFGYMLKSANANVILRALNDLTNVNIISSPSLTVLDNRRAILQVGDQVPILTQSVQSTISPGAPTVNSVTYRDTGVILAITPHINESGRVMLDIEQEVSNVSDIQTSGIDSPTIKQRRVKTSVVMNDSESLTLGGLIQDTRSRGATQVPVLGDIPLLGMAFKDKSDSIGKTELLIMITPRVIRSVSEAQEATDEFKRKLMYITRRARSGPHTIEQSFRRVINDE
jgi:general secretion pathway protein D